MSTFFWREALNLRDCFRRFRREFFSCRSGDFQGGLAPALSGFIQPFRNLLGCLCPAFPADPAFAVEMSRNVQSKNPLNLSGSSEGIRFSEWSVAERRKTDAARRAAVRRRPTAGLLPAPGTSPAADPSGLLCRFGCGCSKRKHTGKRSS